MESHYNVCMIAKKSNTFLTGFLPKIKMYCKRKNYKLNITYPAVSLPKIDNQSFLSFLEKTKQILGTEYRENQLQKQMELIKNAITENRGLLISPTGTGKTTLALGIASHFPDANILYMCHTKVLVSQTAKEFEKYGFSVSQVMEGNKDQSNQIVVATRQSLVNMNLKKYDIIMVDEIHHVSDENCSYGAIIKKLNAPMVFGFTATIRETSKKSQLSIEGLIGSIVGELTMKEAENMRILAKPKIRIIKVPKQFIEARSYSEIYKEAVSESRVFNRVVAKTIQEYIENEKTVLVFVTLLNHARKIQEISENVFGNNIPIIDGKTPTEQREKIKKQLLEKKISAAITTVVWKEGLNIPALDAIINASGGKGDLQIVQMIGRGLRRTKEKTEMDFVDFFDESHSYLIKHFGNRLSLYCQHKWL